MTRLSTLALALAASSPLTQAYFILSQTILETTRLDPIVFPGVVSAHVHTIAGANGFQPTMEYDEMQEATCTTAPVSVDHSNYWVPQLYYYSPDNASFTMIDVDYMNAYYLPRAGSDGIVNAFPDGLRMTSGSPSRRTLNDTDPDDLAISFVCLDFTGANHTGDASWDQRNNFFDHNCPSGLRAQVNFRPCWDGVNLDSDDHESHMAWPSGGVNGGDCPSSHPVHLVSLFYEFIFKVQDFPWNGDDYPTWVFAMGDSTGYGFHGDFINGWPTLVNGSNVLQDAINDCNADNGVGGELSYCSPFVPYLDTAAASACQPRNELVDEDIGQGTWITQLPGDNPLFWNGSIVQVVANVSTPGYYDEFSVLPSGWVDVGCIAEGTTGRALAQAELTATNMTRAICVEWCAAQGYPMAGVEYTDQCYCGTQLSGGATNTTLLPASSCGLKCTGNSYDNCGGSSTLELFVNDALFPAAPSVPSGWSSIGCMTESSGVRALTGYSFTSPEMTITLCVETCAAKGFIYAGAEYSDECYCGDSFSTGSVNASSATCDMACAGDSLHFCGGSNLLSAYGYVNVTTTSTATEVNATATTISTNLTITSIAASTTTTHTNLTSTSTVSANATLTTMHNSTITSTIIASVNKTTSTIATSTSTSTSTSSSASAALPTNWVSVGCMTDSGSTRSLNSYNFASSSMTPTLCITTCAAKGYTYAGTEYADECWCADVITTGTANVSSTTCDMACAGDSKSICGGSSLLSVYENTETVAAPSLPTNWSSYGCITEPSSVRALASYSFTSTSMTNDLCINTCSSLGYSMAGTEYSSQCYCADALSTGVLNATSTDCSMSCAGDSSLICGGSDRLTAFVKAVTVKALPTNWTSIGCITEGTSARALAAYSFTSNSMTTELCIDTCASEGYLYAGTEYSTQCYCANSLSTGAVTASSSDCSMQCPGDLTEMCGGSSRLNLYQSNQTLPTTSATTSSSTTTTLARRARGGKRRIAQNA